MDSTFILILIAAYLIGSIPFSHLIAKSQGVNLRKVGSGNIGATNLGRALGKKYAVLGYILDTAKGAIPVLLAWHVLNVSGLQATLTGLAAILGHIFPIFLGFKGGKGVATGSGVFLVLSPVSVGVALAVWLAIYLSTKYVSLGSIIAAVSLAVYQVLRREPFSAESWSITVFSILVLCVVIITHKKNIERLLSGREPRT